MKSTNQVLLLGDIVTFFCHMLAFDAYSDHINICACVHVDLNICLHRLVRAGFLQIMFKLIDTPRQCFAVEHEIYMKLCDK